MTGSTRFFAIRFGDHVELRAVLRSLRARVSKLTKTYTTTDSRYVGEYPNIRLEFFPRKHKLILVQTVYLGGRVLGTGKYSSFQPLGGSIAKDGILEISRELKNRLIRRWAL